MRLRKITLVTGAVAVGAMTTYMTIGRKPCRHWGATPEEIQRTMPGDDLLVAPAILTTRAIGISAPPSSIWPWLMQMGSGKGGVYTYDWIENLFGLHMHSVDEILPQYQNRQVGDVEQLGSKGPRMRVELLEAEQAMVLRSDDGNWVWAFGLYPLRGCTRLVSRNRIVDPDASLLARTAMTLIMEPGSLIMERKMLLGIKQRAESLAKHGCVASSAPPVTQASNRSTE